MEEKIDRLLEAKNNIEVVGGEDEIEKQHRAGKLTARERLELLYDGGSFMEIAGHASCGVVTGYGTVDGRLVFAYAQDATVRGGALGRLEGEKISRIQDMALKMGGPIIAISDSIGSKIEEGLDVLSAYGKIFYNNTMASGVIPQISLVMGKTAGTGVYTPALSDFVFMVDKTSLIFSQGTKIIKARTKEDMTEEELGGAKTHGEISGISHFVDKSEEESISRLKDLLSYLPSNNLDYIPSYKTRDDINRVSESLNNILPEGIDEEYNMKDIIRTLADEEEFFEVREFFAKNIITGYMRLGGKTIGVIANQPKELSGLLDIDASKKAASFIRTCNAFNIPLLNLIDVKGFLPTLSEEHGGIIKHSAKMIYAYGEATVPKVSLIIRKAYGRAYMVMGSKELGADQVFAWPSGEIALMEAEALANIIYNDEIKDSENPELTRKEKIKECKNTIANPYIAAEKGYIDDVIFPATTRARLASAFDMLESKRETRPSRKHGNLPL